ncbi:MAG: VWA domain-containing protein [Candidatus Omnitrophota bacterium]
MKFGAADMAAWLWLAVLMPAFFVMAARNRERALRRFAGEDPLKEISGSFMPARRKIRNWMITMAVLFSALALMRPQWGFKWQEVTRQGLEMIIALDTSKSMLAEDVLPNRIGRARLAIKDLVKKLKGDKIGLVAFSGSAFLQCPLTIDYNGFLLSLDDVGIDTIPVGGTSLSKAIYTSIDSFEAGKSGEKILLVITDGEDLEGGVEAAVQAAKAKGVKIFCVGIGSLEGELIPVTDDKGKIVFMKDTGGNVVKTRLEEGVLQKMAVETGGMYVHATGAEFGLALIYDKKLSGLEKQQFRSKMEKLYFERFQLLLYAAIMLLFLEPLVIERKRNGV